MPTTQHSGIATTIARLVFGGIALAILLSSGCVNPAIRVYSFHGPAMRFDEQATTFDWMEAPDDRQRQIREEYAGVDQHFRELVTAELIGRGYRAAESEPDVLLDYWFGRRTTGNPNNPGVDRRYALITLDVIEPARLKLIWRSSAEVLIDRSKPAAELRALIAETVTRMLEPVPPRTE